MYSVCVCVYGRWVQANVIFSIFCLIQGVKKYGSFLIVSERTSKTFKILDFRLEKEKGPRKQTPKWDIVWLNGGMVGFTRQKIEIYFVLIPKLVFDERQLNCRTFFTG